MKQYQVIRSKRKTIAISFDRDGNLVVKAPYFLRNYEIDSFVRSKEEWISATSMRLDREKEKQKALRPKLENGEILPYLGEQMLLSVIREDRKRAKVNSVMGRILLVVPYDADYEYRRNALIMWYRKEAAKIIREKAAEFAEKLSVNFMGIHIKDTKSRWGSCSSKGNLNFSWRLVMAPEQVLEYVVIHELCHLRYMDHSEKFWNLVSEFCPAYKQYRKWLRDYGDRLYLF